MKNLITCSLITLFSLSVFADGGDQGNGGEGTAIEFKGTGKQILRQLRANPKEANQIINLDKFDKKLQAANILTSDKPLFLNGVRKDAINYPQSNKIIIDLSRWDSMDFKNQRILVIHEILGLLEIKDLDYQTSIRLNNLANLKLGTCAFQKIVDGEMVDIMKPGLNPGTSVITIDSGKAKATIRQEFERAYIKIEFENLEVNNTSLIGDGVRTLQLKRENIELRLDCVI